MHGLFLWKTKKVLLLLIHFKVFWKVRKENQIKYRLIKTVNFISVFLKSDLKNNCKELGSIYNGGNSVVAERFIRTLKNKIYKQMTAVSKMFTLMF